MCKLSACYYELGIIGTVDYVQNNDEVLPCCVVASAKRNMLTSKEDPHTPQRVPHIHHLIHFPKPLAMLSEITKYIRSQIITSAALIIYIYINHSAFRNSYKT